MEFLVSCCYCTRGEAVLIYYPALKEYEYRLDNEEMYLTVHSLEELIEISNKIGQNFIVDLDSIGERKMKLVIYDDYVE